MKPTHQLTIIPKEKIMNRKQAKAYLIARARHIQQHACMLMDQKGIDVITPFDAVKVLRRHCPNASTMSPNELQMEVNHLLAKALPDAVRKFVHVEDAELPPFQRSGRPSYQVVDDLAEIASMLRSWERERSNLLEF
jgi:hypothetical protein